MISDKEKLKWTVVEPVVCECVEAKVGHITTPKGRQPVFILVLVIPNSGRELNKFYNVFNTPRGNYAVKHNSDFAKLYRLATGVNPKGDYSRAKRLLKHLIGYEFVAEYSSSYSSSGQHYYKVIKLKPNTPVLTDEWFPSGVLRPIKRQLKQKKHKMTVLSVDKQQVGNGLAEDQQRSSNELVMKNGVNPHLNWGRQINSIALQDIASSIEPSLDVISGTYERIEVNGKCKAYYYKQWDNETKDDYWDRVISESLEV